LYFAHDLSVKHAQPAWPAQVPSSRGGIAPGKVQLTLQANLSNGNFIDGNNDSNPFGWGFNYQGVLSELVVTPDGGSNSADMILTGSQRADHDGYYDLVFSWKSSVQKRFEGTDTAIYDLSAPGLSVSDFIVLSSSGKGDFYSAMRVKGLADDEGNPGWVGASPTGISYQRTAPEPSTLVLFGAGAISLLGYRWQRRPNRC
jgi:hypothetical protein